VVAGRDLRLGAVVAGLAWQILQTAGGYVVQARKLWPRSLFPPPLTTEDRRAYQLYAKAQERRPEEVVDVRITEPTEGS
jgi:hypothetical protein